MIKAIAFDLWETLITNDDHVTHSHARLRLDRMSRILSTTPRSIEPAYREVWERCHELYWSADKDVPCRTQIEHFVEALDLNVDEATMQALEHAYATVAVEILPSAVAGAPEVIAELKDRGYKLGLISNTGRTPGYALRAILDRLELGHFFGAMVFSNEHGECKPRRSIFETLRRSLDVDFDEMLFVGDNLYVDVYGAQRCGMSAVHFIPSERGTAVAPDVEHGLAIAPHATIYDLRELPRTIDALNASQHSEAARTHRS
jgi:putative hydrolase of the HAD superfamily